MPRLISVLIFSIALVVSGCRSAPIYNATGVTFAVPPVATTTPFTLDDYKAAIIRGGAKRGWTFEEVAPGHLVGNVAVRGKHFATVDVVFDTQKFSINYKDSRNLDYDAAKQEIHPNYNSWVSNLQNDIQAEITRMKAG